MPLPRRVEQMQAAKSSRAVPGPTPSPGSTSPSCGGCGAKATDTPVQQAPEAIQAAPPEQEPEAPGLLTMAANLTAWTAEWVKIGAPRTTPEQQAVRLETCPTCPSKMFRASNRQCAACGCFVDFKSMGIVQKDGKSDCPSGHWQILEIKSPSAS